VRPADLPERYRAQVVAKLASATPPRTTKRPTHGTGSVAKVSEGETSMLGQIRMAGLPKPETEYVFAAALERKWRFDGAWPDRFVAYEVDGGTWSEGRHVRGGGVENDALKISTAAAMGWRVLRFTSSMVDDGRAIRLIEQALAKGK
jgi:hypothetical protein